jgi:hypothetical protein
MVVRINEVRVAEPVLPGQVELYNGGGTPVDLSTWSLSDDQAIPSEVSVVRIDDSGRRLSVRDARYARIG